MPGATTTMQTVYEPRGGHRRALDDGTSPLITAVRAGNASMNNRFWHTDAQPQRQKREQPCCCDRRHERKSVRAEMYTKPWLRPKRAGRVPPVPYDPVKDPKVFAYSLRSPFKPPSDYFKSQPMPNKKGLPAGGM